MVQEIDNKADKVVLENKAVNTSIKDELKAKAKENENTKPEQHTTETGN